MLTAEQLNEKIFEKLSEKCVVYPQNNLRCSSIGHPCQRFVYLSITNWQDKKPPDAGLQAIFELGNTLETHVIEHIKQAGYEVFTPTIRSFRIDPQGITGREDLRIKDPESGELYPVEIKSISPFEFDKLNTFDDFRKSNKPFIRSYAAQIQLYLYHFAKEQGFFALINKLTGKIKFISVKFDYEFCEEILERAEYINKCLSDKTPPDACDDISFCEGCSLQHICGQCRRIPADIEIDDSLDELINRKEELSPAYREYNEVNDQIKKRVGQREKVITGQYLIQRKSFTKAAYTVPESTQYRITVEKL